MSAKCCSWEGLTPYGDAEEGLAGGAALWMLGRLPSMSPQCALAVSGEQHLTAVGRGTAHRLRGHIFPLYLALIRPHDTASSLGPSIHERISNGVSSGGWGWS